MGNRVQAFLECEAKVIAVEPQPQCASILREKFGQQITIEQVGLGAQSGSLEMLIATDSTVSTFNKEFAIATKERFKFSRWQETIQVPIRTLDTLIKNHGMPRYCKIDVEGFELEVLKGLTKPIPLISIEYCVPEFSESMIACIHRLNEIASSGLFNYSIGESMAWALPEWMTFSAFWIMYKPKNLTPHLLEISISNVNQCVSSNIQ